MNQQTAIILFNEKAIGRTTWHNNEWWFVIIDILQTLTDSVNASKENKKLTILQSKVDNILNIIYNVSY